MGVNDRLRRLEQWGRGDAGGGGGANHGWGVPMYEFRRQFFDGVLARTLEIAQDSTQEDYERVQALQAEYREHDPIDQGAKVAEYEERLRSLAPAAFAKVQEELEHARQRMLRVYRG